MVGLKIDNSRFVAIVAVTTSATVSLLCLGYYLRKKQRQMSFVEVGKVSGIYTYPVKSCKGISLQNAICTKLGIEYDRFWVIIDRGNRFITQTSHPILARLKININGNELTISTQGKDDINFDIMNDERQRKDKIKIEIHSVPGQGVHVSSEVDHWISEFLGKDGYKLYQYLPSCQPRKSNQYKSFGSDFQENDRVAFSSMSPFLLISEPSLGELNSRLEHDAEMERFRPNITISGCKPFEEDTWVTMRINNIEFRCANRCGRCILPTVNPLTGVMDSKEPLATLRKFRLVSKSEDPRYGKSPILGRYLACESQGTIGVGDTVYASQMK